MTDPIPPEPIGVADPSEVAVVGMGTEVAVAPCPHYGRPSWLVLAPLLVLVPIFHRLNCIENGRLEAHGFHATHF